MSIQFKRTEFSYTQLIGSKEYLLMKNNIYIFYILIIG